MGSGCGVPRPRHSSVTPTIHRPGRSSVLAQDHLHRNDHGRFSRTTESPGRSASSCGDLRRVWDHVTG
jgi:hypothetical protein